MKGITIKDVAKALNISTSTVSRAFNNKYDIQPSTRDMILAKAKEMGYSPNPIAQGLIMHKSFMVGVIVPEFVNSFFPQVLMGIQKELNEAGYQVLIMSSNESADMEMKNVKTLEKNNVDGILISLTHETRDISYFQKLLENNLPIVQFNRVSQKLNTPKIIFNDCFWAEKATEHLIKQGYKKIYHLAGPNSLIVTHNRIKGYTNMMKKYHLDYDSSSIIDSGIFIEDGAEAAEKIIEKGDIPEAFFCFNDPVAIGAIEKFREHGYKINEDIAFVGFTESRIGKHMTPGLTSVEQPASEIGSTASKVLLKMLQTKNLNNSDSIVLEGKLNIRESSIKH
jgi:LacI family transcriptional regulator